MYVFFFIVSWNLLLCIEFGDRLRLLERTQCDCRRCHATNETVAFKFLRFLDNFIEFVNNNEKITAEIRLFSLETWKLRRKQWLRCSNVYRRRRRAPLAVLRRWLVPLSRRKTMYPHKRWKISNLLLANVSINKLYLNWIEFFF